MSLKKKILICSPSSVVTEGFFKQTSIFADLTNEFDVSVCLNVDEKLDKSIPFQSHGIKEVHYVRLNSRRTKTFPYEMHINTLGGRKYSANPGVIYEMNKYFYGGLLKRIIHRVLGYNETVARLATRIIEFYVGYNSELENVFKETKPDLIVTFYVGNGPFEVESLKTAKKLGIPSLSLQHGWDHIDTRGLLPFKPDYSGVWGYQCNQTLQKMHGILPERIFNIGAPFADVFRAPNKKDYVTLKKEIGVPDNKRVIFFAGTGNAFNEVKLLKYFENAIEQGALKDCCVLYRPHPRLVQNDQDRHFFKQDYKHIYMDPVMTKLYNQAKEGAHDDGKQRYIAGWNMHHMNDLIEVSDIVVAPLSTVQIQAAMKGVASVFLVFVDKTNRDFRNRYRFEEHKISRGMPGMFVCPTNKQLIEKCLLAMRFSEKQENRDLIKHYSGFAIQNDSFSYTERLRQAIRAILKTEKYKDEGSMYNYLSEPELYYPNSENVVDLDK